MKPNYLRQVLPFALVSLLSCSSDPLEVEPEYELVSVHWKLEESAGDGQSIFLHELEEFSISNNDTVPLPYEFYPFEDVFETSYFNCGNTDIAFLKKWLPSNMDIAIPSDINLLSNSFLPLTSAKKTALVLGERRELENRQIISYEEQIPPRSQLVYGGTLYMKKINATCCFSFVVKGEPQQSVDIIVRWEGELYDYTAMKIKYEDIA